MNERACVCVSVCMYVCTHVCTNAYKHSIFKHVHLENIDIWQKHKYHKEKDGSLVRRLVYKQIQKSSAYVHVSSPESRKVVIQR
jgi:hypothetical protein